MPPTTNPGPGARLRAARRLRGLSVKELARRLNVTPQAIGNIESDTRPVSLDKILEIATMIGCDPHEIDERLATNTSSQHPR